VSENNGAGRGGRSGRWQRREQRRTSERSQIKKHGARMSSVYAAAIRKRLRARKKR
jgi:hypothetical protein